MWIHITSHLLCTFINLIMTNHTPIQRFFHITIGWCVLIYSIYWMYLCCGEHWRRAIGPQNLIILLFVVLLSFIALLFYTQNMLKAYYVTTLILLIPTIIVCYINRASRYPDIAKLITAFNNGNLDDPIYIGYRSVYSLDFLEYEYITSRSSSASFTLFLLQAIWFIILIYNMLFSKKV
ncbi:hypothetical protein TRFO_42598 [Tritrichomonas foetus]|uniref:Uncharacterized protein n=1 Tax=Tritrichomonas foetus TaxID=1144522 RepID=A0A1J4KVE2_9EUKA|nr:hypothetical protein TRFO_42598 [Tritrichomonas foetus]|eukprot:OHT15281.1 hypothetical protein TRFO_42598 [Tritrichomonas foetus]